MSTKLEKLTFSIGLLDRVSAPVRRIQKTLGRLAESSEQAFTQIGTGAAGVAGAGYAMYRFINPAEQMQRALGEVASLDVGQQALQQLSGKALEYSVEYGRAADGFVRSAYDIQSAISGLGGDELAAFTNAGNVLATATKANAGTITNYMGTMYGVFQQEAEAMGKAAWVEQLAGRTATAVQMFKTTGSAMSSAFSSVGANATAAGIEAAEQMAVLGKLQTTMSGSEAGTKYKAFLGGVGRAQEKLGLSFTDSQGNMLGMLEILEKIKGRFGESLNVGEADALKEAFGREEAVDLLKLMMADTEGLAASIDKLGKVSGMEKAEEMAGKMVTPMMRLNQGVSAVTTGIGQALMPALNPLVDTLADAAAALTAWTKEFPTLTKWVGFGVLGILGMTGALGALAMIAGLSKVAVIGWTMATTLGTSASTAFTAVLGAFKAVMLAVNAVLLANPLILIIGSIIALIGLVAAAIYYWEDLMIALGNTEWADALMKAVDWVLEGLKSLMNPVGWVVEKVGALVGFGDDETDAPASSPSLDAPRRSSVAPGSVTKHVANTVANSRSEQRSIGKVVINTDKGVSKQDLDELLMMGA
jgi:TP901 family phage tail tape measure protein